MRLIFLIIPILFFACRPAEKEVVLEYHANGAEKILVKCLEDTSRILHYMEKYPSGELFKEIKYDNEAKFKEYENHFYKNGEVKLEGKYKLGLRFGIWKSYFPTGQLQSIRNYGENELEEGMSEVYKKDGDHYYLYYSGYYSKGKKRGTWHVYNRDGDIIKTINN